ncbi:MAG: 4-phosphopantetheinyl transferase, partial [Flavobacteriaceae bacterium]|nr:4-phosphopantetheinyl transferase [Flavobacteriaceae bacterium]
MPLYKTINPKKNTKIYIWDITESIEELNTLNLTQKSDLRLRDMKSELHQKGFLSIRHLLKIAGYTDKDLYYNGHGKPHLTDCKNISITHSYTFSGIIIGDDEVGIDIEKNREKVKLIAHKFVGPENDFLVKKNLVEQLTVL